jgi:type IX secretion system PorP/SprF family membrane protein
MKRIFKVILLSCITLVAFGQDPQFTQFYAAPLYHNPAFTGSGYAPRLIFNYRNQWPSLGANFVTTVVSVDHFFDKANSGVGIMMVDDAQGPRISNRELGLLYSYQMSLGGKSSLRMGLQGSYSKRGFDPSGLIFGDQLSNSGVSGTSQDPILGELLNYVDFLDVGTGFLFYNPKLFLGVSAYHLTEPANSFADKSSSVPTSGCQNGDCLPRKIMVNGGFNINLNHLVSASSNADREFTLTPTFLYKKQAQFSQLDLSLYATYTPLTLGMSYRGIPMKKVFNSLPNQDALTALVGFRMDNFSIGYSYDLTISGLGAGSGGSHEISFSYQLDKFENERTPYIKQRKKELACPKF